MSEETAAGPDPAARPLKINLGCGGKRLPGFVGVDVAELPAVDVKMDVREYLRSLKPSSVSHVYSRHFLEHVEGNALRDLLLEIDRVLRPGGHIEFIVPHFSNPYYYSDPTHRQPFGVHTFSYLCERSCLRRGVPQYACIPGWNLVDVKLGFVPYAQPRLLGGKVPMLSGLLNRAVNLGYLTIELFERYFCWWFTIYEVRFRIEKRS